MESLVVVHSLYCDFLTRVSGYVIEAWLYIHGSMYVCLPLFLSLSLRCLSFLTVELSLACAYPPSLCSQCNVPGWLRLLQTCILGGHELMDWTPDGGGGRTHRVWPVWQLSGLSYWCVTSSARVLAMFNVSSIHMHDSVLRHPFRHLLSVRSSPHQQTMARTPERLSAPSPRVCWPPHI